MEFELWWLLAIPLIFLMGWLAARVDIRHVVRESQSLPKSYFKGLNFLLNEQPDKAIDAFLEATKVDSETVELHFALGNLFRRRGEADRAIRMHLNLVEREGLREEQRQLALAELGHDYLKAGLLDRAEEIFTGLLGTQQNEAALDFLLEIYQQEKEWRKAIGIARQLPSHSGHLRQMEIANFYCELAAAEINNSHPQEARRLLEDALATHRKSVRANLLLGDLHAGADHLEEAIEAWQRIEQQNPIYLSLVAARLLDACRKLGRGAEGLRLLRGYLAEHPSLDLLDAAFRAALEFEGPEAACHLVKEELRRNPTLLGLDKLLEAQLLTAPAEWRDDLEMMKNLIHDHTRKLARYRCDHCGFKARQFYWRCPGCGTWESYPPKRTEEFDLTP